MIGQHTIQLRINNKVYDKFLWLVSRFNKEEVENISDDKYFTSTKQYLQEQLNEIKEGKGNFINQSEFENRLDQVI